MFKIIKEIRSKAGVLHFRRRKIFSFKDYFLCIHEFYEAEQDLYEHDHPRDFICMNIWGGYKEVHNGNVINVPLFKPRFIPAEYHHRILSLNNGKMSISISFSFPYKREWGYVKPDKTWISKDEYFKSKH